ncbi:MAG: universal stress protein [Deltaproteobacteria bacterium]|nr:universal stress protein [Candidatus Anaeroferrophillus wilburensis]MBN2890006.1 universal stress protein [Deltaproteobacteria bacterium]
MLQYEKILIAVDFSEITSDVVDVGCRFAKDYGASVKLLHVVEEGFLLLGLDGLSLPAEDLESIRSVVESRKKSGQEKMVELLERGRQLGVSSIDGEVVEGYPASTIVDAASEQHSDAIFMGSHGWSGIKRFLMGSVANNVVKNAKCSVMVVRRQQGEINDD